MHADGPSAPPPRVIEVLAAVVERDGQILVTRRPRGTHLAGLWEFPGGKCEPGETHDECLRRELLEELGVESFVGRAIFTTEHAYPDRTVRLHFHECEIEGEPVGLIGQEIRWIARTELGSLEFPPADEELIRRLAGDEPR